MKPGAPFSRSLRTLATLAFLVYIVALGWLFVVKNPTLFLTRLAAFNWQHAGQYANFIPGRTMLYYLTLQENARTGFDQIGGNLIGFLPFGFLLPLAWQPAQKLKTLALTAFLVSLSFEIFQFCTNVGSFDVDDLLLNLSGAVCGFFLLRWVLRALAR
jgi:glycopeptide antibiotics resistance protein